MSNKKAVIRQMGCSNTDQNLSSLTLYKDNEINCEAFLACSHK